MQAKAQRDKTRKQNAKKKAQTAQKQRTQNARVKYGKNGGFVVPKGNGRVNDRIQEQIKRSARKPGAADIVLRADGGHGTDTRVSEHQVVRLSKVANLDETMDIRVPLRTTTLESLAYGIALYALKRGLGTQLGYANLYYAYVYLVQTFLTTARGTFPAVQQAPRWFWAICEALKPKTRPFKTGSVSYRWEPDAPNDYVPAQFKDFGGYRGWLSTPDPDPLNTTNGFPNINSGLVPPYSETLGTQAIQLIFDCFGESFITEKTAYEETWLNSDTSAFAWSYPEWGQTLNGPGGVATTLFCEKKILAPIFAKFAMYQADGVWRGAQELRKGAGSPMYICPRSIEFSSMRDYGNKQSPIYKPYDFDEFFEQLSLTLGGAMSVQSGIVGEVVVQCPLTPQRAQILLRQAMIQVFGNNMGMDISVAGSGSLPWAPFSVAVNGVSQTLEASGGMLLPVFICENIRACGRKTSALLGGKKRSGVAIQDEIPILGRYAVPQLGNYQYQPEVGVPIDIYDTDLGELPISLTDGATPILLPTNWVSFDGAEIMNLANNWNLWITKLASFLSPLYTIGAEKGIDVLSTPPLTTHCSLQEPVDDLITRSKKVTSTQPQPTKPGHPGVSSAAPMGKEGMPPTRKASVSRIGTTLKKIGVTDPPPLPESDFFTTVKVVQTTSMFPLHDPVWKYLKHFIHPTAVGTVNDEQGVPFQQSLAVEPFKISYSAFDQSSTSMMSLYDKHLNASRLDVRTRLAPLTEMAEEFNELAKRGRGGLFTGIAGALGNMLGIPGSKDFMAGVSDLTGGLF